MSDQQPLAVYTETDDLDPAAGTEMLQNNGFRVVVAGTRDPDAIADAAQGAVALLVGYARIDATLLDRLPELRVIALLSRGFDNVDLAAATERGVWVSTVGDVASEEVATHAWTLSLALLRGIGFFSGCGTERDWLARPRVLPRRLSQTTIGVLGLGSTGRRYARLAACGAGHVLAYDITPRGPREDLPGVAQVDFDTVIGESDLVSLHLPLTTDTSHIIDAEVLASMRDDAYLVNVSRGGLVDGAALLAALDSGDLAGAALDVFDPEPPAPGERLLTHPDVLTTPHVAYLSDASAAGYIEEQAGNVLAWHRAGRPVRPVNDVAQRSEAIASPDGTMRSTPC